MESGTYNYSISYQGYRSETGSVTISNGNVTKNVFLSPQSYPLVFKIAHNNEPVENANIVVDASQLKTDSTGEATKSLVNGTYYYTVTASGFEPYSDSIVISGYSHIENVELKAKTYLVTFEVTDENGPLENATISINDSVWVTDSVGTASLYLPNGEYTYTVSADGFGDITENFTVSSAPVTKEVSLVVTDIETITSSGIRVYPNPATEWVEIDAESKMRIELINVNGQVIRTRTVFSSKTRIQVDDLKPGIYILNIHKENQSGQQQKLLIR